MQPERIELNVTYESLEGAADLLDRLDRRFGSIVSRLERFEQSPPPLRIRVETSSEQTVLIEGAGIDTTLYVAANAASERDDFDWCWRIWRPSRVFLHPEDHAWLSRHGFHPEEHVPALPERYDRRDGWHDPSPEALQALCGALRWTDYALRTRQSAA